MFLKRKNLPGGLAGRVNAGPGKKQSGSFAE